MRRAIWALLALGLSAGAALARESPICTDRPTKANAVCTVPRGRWQLETDAVNWARVDSGGTRTDTVLWTNPTLKLGLDDATDLEVNWQPWVSVESRAGGSASRTSASGDLYLRLKRRLSAPDAAVGVAAIPFVKVPTARRGIGNGAVEGGLALPVTLAGPAGFTVVLGPEVDVVLDADGSGRHANLVNLVNVARPIGDNLTLAAEVWTASSFDPRGTTTQASADVALAWGVTRELQLDAGANVGLNADTPDLQLYAGVSRRF